MAVALWSCIIPMLIVHFQYISATNSNCKNLNQTFSINNREPACILLSDGSTQIQIKIIEMEVHYLIQDIYTFFHPAVDVDCECTCGDFDGKCSYHTADRDNECAMLYRTTEQLCTNFYIDGDGPPLCPKYYKVCCQTKFSIASNEFYAIQLRALQLSSVLLEVNIGLKNQDSSPNTIRIPNNLKRVMVNDDILIEMNQHVLSTIIPDDWYYLAGSTLMGNVSINGREGEDFNKLGWFQKKQNKKLIHINKENVEKYLRVKPTNCQEKSVKYDWSLNAVNFYRNGKLEFPTRGRPILDIFKEKISNINFDSKKYSVSFSLKDNYFIQATVTQETVPHGDARLRFTAYITKSSESETIVFLNITSGRGDFQVIVGNPIDDLYNNFNIVLNNTFPFYHREKIYDSFINGTWICFYDTKNENKQLCTRAEYRNVLKASSTMRLFSPNPTVPGLNQYKNEGENSNDNSNDKKTESNESSGSLTKILAGVLTPLFVIIIFAIVALIMRKRKKQKSIKKEHNYDDSAERLLKQNGINRITEDGMSKETTDLFPMESMPPLLIIPLPKVLHHKEILAHHVNCPKQLFIRKSGSQNSAVKPEKLFSEEYINKSLLNKGLSVFMQSNHITNLIYNLAIDYISEKDYMKIFDNAYLVLNITNVDNIVWDILKQENLCLNNNEIAKFWQSMDEMNLILFIDNKETRFCHFRDLTCNNNNARIIFHIVNENEEETLMGPSGNAAMNLAIEIEYPEETNDDVYIISEEFFNSKNMEQVKDFNPILMRLISQLLQFRDKNILSKTITNIYEDYIDCLMNFTDPSELSREKLQTSFMKLGEISYNAYLENKSSVTRKEFNILPENKAPIFNLIFANVVEEENNYEDLEFLNPYFFYFFIAHYLSSLVNKEIQFKEFPFAESNLNSLIRKFWIQKSVISEKNELIFIALKPWAFWCSANKFNENKHMFQPIIDLLGKVNFKVIKACDYFHQFIPKVWDITNVLNEQFYKSEWHKSLLAQNGIHELIHLIRWNPSIAAALPKTLHVHILELLFTNNNDFNFKTILEGKKIYCVNLVLHFQSGIENFIWSSIKTVIEADKIDVIVEPNAISNTLPSLCNEITRESLKDNCKFHSLACQINTETIYLVKFIKDIIKRSHIESLILHLSEDIKYNDLEIITELYAVASDSETLTNLTVKTCGKFNRKLKFQIMKLKNKKIWNYFYIDKNSGVAASELSGMQIQHLEIDAYGFNIDELSKRITSVSQLKHIGSESELLKLVIEKMIVSKCKEIEKLDVKIHDEFYQSGIFKEFCKLPNLKDLSISFLMRTIILTDDDINDLIYFIIENKLRSLSFLDIDFNVLKLIIKIMDALSKTSAPVSRLNSTDSNDDSISILSSETSNFSRIHNQKMYLVQTFNINFKGKWSAKDVNELFANSKNLLSVGRIETIALINLNKNLYKILYEVFPPLDGFEVSWDIPEITNEIENMFKEKISIKYSKCNALKLKSGVVI